MSTVKTNITDEQFKDLLCCAFEGGSNYWIEKVETHRPNPAKVEFWHEAPVYGGQLTVIVSEEEPIQGKGKVFELTRASLESGAQVMADKHPVHFADWTAENSDATTGDVFLQCCLFGDAIFG